LYGTFPENVAYIRTGQEFVFGSFSSVVHSVSGVLAVSAAGVSALSAGLAILTAIQDSRDCGGRNSASGVGGGHASGEVIDRSVPSLKHPTPRLSPESAAPIPSSPSANPSMFLSFGADRAEETLDDRSQRAVCRENHTNAHETQTSAH